MPLRSTLALGLLGLIVVFPADRVRAQPASTLTIEQPWSRATPGGAKVAGGFLTIRNAGPAPDRLVGGSTGIAGRVEIHETTMADGISRMRELDQGIAVSPGGAVELKPGGYHLMFQDLKQPLKEGDRFTAILRFEHAGERPVEFRVEGVGTRASTGHGHKH